MQLFEDILDQAQRDRQQVHVCIGKLAYFNIILHKVGSVYSSHFNTDTENGGIHFTIENIDQILVQQGTDGRPSLQVNLKP